MILAYDRNKRPVHKGDIVTWLVDGSEHRVIGPADGIYDTEYMLDSSEQGYVELKALANRFGTSQRFGINIELVRDPELEVDEGL